MGAGLHGVNHVASCAKNMDETVRFYEKYLGVKIKRIANDSPRHKHYSLDLGGEGTLDFFEAKPGTQGADRDALGALNHLALTADPAFIDEAERRLRAAAVKVRVTERVGQRTIYFEDPNGINVQLYPATGGSRA